MTVIVNGAPFVNDSFQIEHDLLVNTLSTEVASVGAGGGSIVSVSPSGDLRWGRAAPGPRRAGLLRPGRHAADGHRCVPAHGHPRPGGVRRWPDTTGCRGSRHGLRIPGLPHVAGGARRFAWKIALNNIAEEVSRCALRHGLDTRDFSLMAFGAAGPMLLAGVLDLVKARRLIVPPHPGLFSAIGLLSTDFVYAAQPQPYQMLTPDSAAQIEAIFAGLERSCASASTRKGTSAEVDRSSSGAVSTAGSPARAGRRRSSTSTPRPSRRRHGGPGRRVPRRVQPAQRRVLRADPGAGRHLAGAADRPYREAPVARDRTGARRAQPGGPAGAAPPRARRDRPPRSMPGRGSAPGMSWPGPRSSSSRWPRPWCSPGSRHASARSARS